MNQEIKTVKIYNKSNNAIPSYSTEQAAGMDLRAFIEEPITIMPNERKLIHTGIHVSLPVGYEIQVRPRSGLAFKNGITVLNTPGTIDADYRGEIGVILVNLSNEPFSIYNGDRIAQMVLNQVPVIEWQPAPSIEELGSSERGEGGFGHSGVK